MHKFPIFTPIRKEIKLLRLLIFCCLIVLVISLTACLSTDAPQNSESEHNFYQPAIAQYHGIHYIHRGEIADSLPDETDLLGEVHDVGTSFDIQHDFDGNLDGFLYRDPNNDHVLYFVRAQWNTETYGPAPYLILRPNED